jgi:hypothetical protein
MSDHTGGTGRRGDQRRQNRRFLGRRPFPFIKGNNVGRYSCKVARKEPERTSLTGE